MDTTCGFRHAPFSDVFAAWHSTTFRAGLLPLFVAPLPVWVGLKMGFFDLTKWKRKKTGQHRKQENMPFCLKCLELCTWNAKSWYFCFSLAPRAYHHSPRILLTVLLSWFGCRWCTNARWRLLNIIKAFIGLRMWSFSLWKCVNDIWECKITSELSKDVWFFFCTTHWHANLSGTVFIAIFGQCTEGLSAPFYWRCREGLLWYNSWEEAKSRVVVFIRNLLKGPYGGFLFCRCWRSTTFKFVLNTRN